MGHLPVRLVYASSREFSTFILPNSSASWKASWTWHLPHNYRRWLEMRSKEPLEPLRPPATCSTSQLCSTTRWRECGSRISDASKPRLASAFLHGQVASGRFPIGRGTTVQYTLELEGFEGNQPVVETGGLFRGPRLLQGGEPAP